MVPYQKVIIEIFNKSHLYILIAFIFQKVVPKVPILIIRMMGSLETFAAQ